MEASGPKAPKESSGAAIAVVLLVVLVLLPILYVLSLGPVIWMVNRAQAEPGIFMIIYAPLEWLHRNSELAKRILDAYIELWR